MLDALGGELGADLGPQVLPGTQIDDQVVEPAHRDPLVPVGHQVHLDAVRDGVPVRAVRVGVGVEVRAELAVHDHERVPVERRGDPGGVVVGGEQPRLVLDQVRSEQEPVAGGEGVGDRRQEGPTLVRVEVADRRAQEGEQGAPAGGDPVQVAAEVADHGVDGDARVPLGDRGGRGSQDLLADVDGRERAQRPGRPQGVEQQTGLVGGARSELDEGAGSGEVGDLVGAGGEDRPLGLGRVVLVQPGDAVEQMRADLVVEPDRRRPRWVVGQSAAGLLGQVPGPVRGVEVHPDPDRPGGVGGGGHRRGDLRRRWPGAGR